MESLDPNELDLRQKSGLLLGAITPRPIALVSTVSKTGVPNLSPFSFFNIFGTNPPVLGFSPSNRGRDGTYKDTYLNIRETKECVVQLVTYPMGQQINLASGEFDPNVDEFVKSGLTPAPSDLVAPARVKESPFQMECKLRDIINLGEGPASGNLVLCDVIRIHIAKSLDWRNGINSLELDTIGRLGGAEYIRMQDQAIFSIEKPAGKNAMGFENLPAHILNSKILTGNNLAALANCESPPSKAAIVEFLNTYTSEATSGTAEEFINSGNYRGAATVLLADENFEEILWHKIAKAALEAADVDFAWKALLVFSQ